jgi:hypothetical protein
VSGAEGHSLSSQSVGCILDAAGRWRKAGTPALGIYFQWFIIRLTFYAGGRKIVSVPRGLSKQSASEIAADPKPRAAAEVPSCGEPREIGQFRKASFSAPNRIKRSDPEGRHPRRGSGGPRRDRDRETEFSATGGGVEIAHAGANRH